MPPFQCHVAWHETSKRLRNFEIWCDSTHVTLSRSRFAPCDSLVTLIITGNHSKLPRGADFNFSHSSECSSMLSLWVLEQLFFVLFRGKWVTAAKVIAVKLSYTNCAPVCLQWDCEPSWMIEPNCWQPHIFGVNQLCRALQCTAWLAKAVYCWLTCRPLSVERFVWGGGFEMKWNKDVKKLLKGHCRFPTFNSFNLLFNQCYYLSSAFLENSVMQCA